MPPVHTLPSATGSALASLRRRIDRLEGASAIKRLQRAFGYYLDQGSWDEAADLFTADASMEIALDGVFKGRERIRQYFYARGGGRKGLQDGELREALQLQPVVHVAPDAESARARWRAFVLAGRCGESAFWAEGPYENTYRREDGVWKISRLHWYQTFLVPYAGGWAENADATGGVSGLSSPTPDAAPTERYPVWPGVHTPPFHFTTVGSSGSSARGPSECGPGLQQLERRIDRLEDTAAIENLIGAYGYFLDKQLWDRLTELFAEDGSMEVSLRGVYVGRRSIRRALELFGPQGIQTGCLHNHLQLQPVIHVSADGSRAWSRSRAFSQLGTYQGTALWHGGVYECEFVKIEGAWKYKRDHVYTTYFADYARGWAAGARAAPKPSDTHPPDSPPTEHYEVFPGRYIPPFHYRHPVTGACIGPQGPGPSAQLEALATLAPEMPVRVAIDESDAAAVELQGAERALRHLEDEQAIEVLQRTCGYLLDKGLCREAADLFCEDGILEIASVGTFIGRQRIVEYLLGLWAPAISAHMLFDVMQLQPVITIREEGTAARGRWHCFVQAARHGEWANWGLQLCENEYAKEDGVWKIRRLAIHWRLSAPYEGGWLRATGANASAPWIAGSEPSPDTLASLCPDTAAPPCHFSHPVTGEPAPSGVTARDASRTGAVARS